MRVSTSQVFDSGILGIQRNQSNLFKTQNQLSTGRRVLTPADDPIAASQALVVDQSKSVNTQYLDNQGLADSQLSLVDTKLSGVIDELQNILEKSTEAGNGSLDVGQKGMIAEELKGRLQNIISLANSQDGEGLYIFSGFKSQTQPFAVTGNAGPHALANPYVSYNGDNGQRKLQVSASQDMSISESGADAFMQIRDDQGNIVGRSMFDAIKNMIDILDPNSGVPFTQATYDQALGDMQSALGNVSRIQASVGSRLSALDSLGNIGEDLNLQYQKQLSNLQDLDYAKAISSLSWQQMQLQASQQSFSQTNRLSLFNYI